MTSRKRATLLKNMGKGYAWMLEDGEMCDWAEPSQDLLLRDEKPSPGAKIVRVYLMKRQYFKDLCKSGSKPE